MSAEQVLEEIDTYLELLEALVEATAGVEPTYTEEEVEAQIAAFEEDED